ncbi:APC family permease [Streptomyces sp. MST-110588]|uniref:APC family permease n=1 Tax=Streptomyces sp. MST-110588 TaxID=2833628 RepID=UPI001F5D682A|nr:APC family permease [Streptomyces sp. MST-110588]UNO42958.1 APC family permease [Streptomyces sp. MST-110588]
MPTGSTSSRNRPNGPDRPKGAAAGGPGTAGAAGGISTFKGQERALRADRIGTPGLLLSVLAASAPLMVVAGVMATTYQVMGIVGQPLLFVILGVVMALFSVGYAEMSRHVHNAGAFYAYIARGLGGTAGAGASFVALAAYNALQVGIYGIFGFEVAGLLDRHFHLSVAWWVPALLAVVVTGTLGALKIDLNAKVLGVLLVIEVALILVFDIAFAADPGPQGLSVRAFDPATLGGAGLGTALCFAVAAFVGFEQAPVYAEETSRPQTVVARVMFLAVGFVAVFFALSSWLIGVATGPDHVVAAAGKEGPGLIFSLTGPRLGAAFTDVLHVFFVTGIFASMLSFHNVVARYVFAMGREGLLPAALGRTSRTSGAPALGSLLQTVIALLVVGGFALTDHGPAGDPTTPVLKLFTWAGNVGALGVIVLMTTASVAVIAFFVRRGAGRAQGWRLTASALAALSLLAVLLYAVKDFGVLVGAEEGSALRWVLPALIGGAALAGLVYGRVLRATRPQVHARIGLGNEAFQLEKAASAAPPAAPRHGAPRHAATRHTTTPVRPSAQPPNPPHTPHTPHKENRR